MYLNFSSVAGFQVSSFETPLIPDLGPLLCLIFFLVPVILASFLFCFPLIFLVTTVAVSSAGPSSLLLLEHFAFAVKFFLLPALVSPASVLGLEVPGAPAVSAAASKALPSAPRGFPGLLPESTALVSLPAKDALSVLCRLWPGAGSAEAHVFIARVSSAFQAC